jgi:protein O-GlcNAc transferase
MVTHDILAQASAALGHSDLDEALNIAERNLRIPENQVEAICVMAAVAFRQDDWARSLLLLERVAEQPNVPSDVDEVLAVLNCLVGRLSAALVHAKLSSTHKTGDVLEGLFGPEFPKFADAFANIGERPLLRRAKLALRYGLRSVARNMVEQHLTINPSDIEALDFQSALLEEDGAHEEAIGVLRSVQTLGGQSATLLSRLARGLMATGDRDASLACHDLAMARAPSSIAIHAAALEAWEHHPHAAGRRHQACLEAWRKLVMPKIPKVVRALPPVAPGGRRTIGYLCSNVVDDAVRSMIGRIAARHDRGRFNVIGFGSGDLADNSNLAYRNSFPRWREISQLDELTLAALVRGEGVDILIDCDGLSAPAHHGLYVRNAARVQLSWLNMPSGEMLPGAHASLAGSNLATGPYLLSAERTIASGLPAAASEGALTFGADVSITDFNPDVALAWSLVLQGHPNSMLALRDDGHFSQPERTTELVEMFGNFGVAHRIDIISGTRAEFWSQVDIALASFPSVPCVSYGEALAAGIPVVTMDVGQAAGFAASVHATGHGDTMVAADLARYVELATQWASDLDRLADYRRTAPAGIVASPVYDVDAFVRGLEAHLDALLVERSAG